MQRQATIQSMQLIIAIAIQDSPSVTVLLGYIDHCIALKNMLVTFHYGVCAQSNTENINTKLCILRIL